jgi:hypothetical protein
MGNSIKYTTGTESNSLVKGNFRIGTGDVGKGPSSSTGFYKATAPPSGGYRVYTYNDNVSGDIAYFDATNNNNLISYTNGISGESFETVEQCFEYYKGQTDKICINNQIESIPTDNLTTHIDFGQVSCVDRNTNSVGLLASNSSSSNGQLRNSPQFVETNGGGVDFDGTNQDVFFQQGSWVPNGDISSGFTICMWVSDFTSNNNRDPFFQTSNSFGDGFFRNNNFLGQGMRLELFVANSGQSGRFFRGDTLMTINNNYPIFLCLNVIDTGQNLGCYLIMNNGNSGLTGGVFSRYQDNRNYILGFTPVLSSNSRIASTDQNFFLNATVNMFSVYNKSFFPRTTDIPAADTIPTEIQQYYNATKGRFGL